MEGELAETASKRPLALTIGAAAVTLLVILGVLTGPSVATCFNSPEGMGQCLRGRMVEVGLIPAPPATAVAEVDAAAPDAGAEPAENAAPAEPADDTAAVSEEPALDVTPPAAGQDASPSPATDDMVQATFGLLRAEPDGSVVIAGSGTPGSEVEVFADDELLGSATVEASGDWVLVPDAPLAPGGREITLGEAGKTSRAAESFVVVIDEDQTSQPLVVASTPGEASEVLQGLTAPAADAMAAASAPEPTEDDLTIAQADAPEPAPTGPSPIPNGSQPEGATIAAPETSSANAAGEPEVAISPESATPTPEAVEPAAAATAPAADAGTEPAEAQNQPAADASEPAVPETAAIAEPEAEPSSVEPAAPTGSQPAANTPAAEPSETLTAPAEVAAPPVEAAPQLPPALDPPTIDAIEIEGDRTFFAGAGTNGGTVRLYVDDQFIADAPVEDGRWLVEAGDVLDSANQRVRADLLAPGSADVASRAEVDFVVELPETEAPVAVAQADEATNEPSPAASPSATQSSSPPPSPPSATQTASEPASPAVSVETTPAEPQANEPAASSASEAVVATEEPDATVQSPSVAPAPSPETPTPPSAQEPIATSEPPAEPAAETVAPVPAPAAPADPQPAVTEPEAQTTPTVEPDAAVTEEPAAPATEPDVPTMVAVSLGDPEAQRFVSGKAIIRRGDNLWTIARRVYGEGIRYTTIYDANTGQIRDPDRIYPGQVFDLPETP